jgi:uncharacterized protein (DUF362 family)
MPRNLDTPVFIDDASAYPHIPEAGLVGPHPGLPKLFRAAGLDPENPFGDWIKPGMRVLVKPNWVRHAAEGWSILEALTTHPSLIRPVVELAAKALRNASGDIEGQIVLADAPLQSANFDLLIRQSGIEPLIAYWRSQAIPVVLADLRRVIALTDETTGVVQTSYSAPGDPRGDTVVDLHTASRLETLPLNAVSLGVSNYDSAQTSAHHHAGHHCYRIANSLLDADVVLNLPKWKTHVKTGITGALKNFIGINCDKAYLPHFRVGSPNRGGDEYPDSMTGAFLARMRPWLERVIPDGLIRQARRTLFSAVQNGQTPPVFGGAWPGNDTLWRTVHDMVFIARWLGPGGTKLSSPRPILTLLDAIVAGEGDGPLRPEPRLMNTLVFGTDPGQVDVYAAALSGFRWRDLPLLFHLTDPEAASISQFSAAAILPPASLNLKPPAAWIPAFGTHGRTRAERSLTREAA